MVEKDQTDSGKASASKAPKAAKKKRVTKTTKAAAKKKSPSKVAVGAPPAATSGPAPVTPAPEAPPAGRPEPMWPSTVSAASEADHKPVLAGIDALAIVQKAEEQQRGTPPTPPFPAGPEAHPSAAEVITRTMARDHPAAEPVPRATKPAAPKRATKAPSKPRLVPARPLPAEPREPIGGIGAEGLPPPLIDEADVVALLEAEHHDPFSCLGMHASAGTLIVRVFAPGAHAVDLIDAADGKVLTSLNQVHDEGLFAAQIKGRKAVFAYRLRIATDDGDMEVDDPYRFPPVLSDKDATLLARGEHLQAYRVLGAHPTEMDGVAGVRFAVWAPNASRVAVVGDFNGWDGRRHGMRLRLDCGVWEIFLPDISAGALYKYEVKSAPGAGPQLKSDPYAFFVERGAEKACVVHDSAGYRWRDGQWLKQRRGQDTASTPLSFYELHLGSWRRKPEEDNRWLSYRETADELVAYVSDLGFTHVALLPISEYTFEDTVGYLPSSLYAVTSRYGSPEDFCYLVDACHRAGIGVVMDWVPNFLSEEHQGLPYFDGTALYEHPDPHQGRDPDWHMPLYNLGRPEVVNYLLANALYWLDRFHLDGLRIDSLAKLLYLDYGRGPGEWTPNRDGGNENLEALAFVRRLTEQVAKHHPGALTIAEDSSLRQGVTASLGENNGLGFELRWNTAWAYDTLRYLGRHPVHRKYYQYELTNPLSYAFDERFVLPVSHHQVSIGHGAMVSKLPGDRWQKFATLRAWYGLLYGMPGKKLLFMGTEIGQDREWNSDISLDWHLLGDDMHGGVQALIRDLNRCYRDQPALHELDSEASGFEWIDFADEDSSVLAFVRYNADRSRHVVVVTHFTPVVRRDYRIGVPWGGRYVEVLNTDAASYGGGNKGSGGEATAEPHWSHGREHSVSLTLPPYATVILAPAEASAT